MIPRLLRRVKLTCNSELFLLVAIAVCLGTAALAQAVGFSVALGAFLAGLSISGWKTFTMRTLSSCRFAMLSWRCSLFRWAP